MTKLLLGLWVAALWSDALAAQMPEHETTRLADGVYQFRFRAHHGLFVVTGDGVVAIDPISNTAATHFAEAIQREAPGLPLLAIVYSHDHADHATGATILRQALRSDAPIIAHRRARTKLVERGDPTLPPPDITFEQQVTLHFGGRPLELHYLGKSHSDNMVVAFLPEDRLAFAVDFVTNDGVGYRALPDYHFPEFFATLPGLLDLDFDTIAFGHGPPGDRATIERQLRYYDDLRQAVEAAIERGLSEEEAAAQVRLTAYRDWRGYDDWFPLNVRAIYRWLRDSEQQ
jgi:cyclase